MKLNPFRVFLAIVDTGSQHAAARALGLTQPAVTKSLQRLEADLGARLFERSVHGAMLTDYGQALLVHARLIDAELDVCVQTVEQLRGRQMGSISIALSHMPGTLLLPDVLPAFRRKWPDVTLRIAAGAYPFLLGQIREGSLDFAIAPAPPHGWPEDLLREPLMPTRLMPVVRRGHALAGPQPLAALAGAEWVLPTQESASAQALQQAMAGQGLPPPVCRLTCETFTAMISAIAASDLVGLVPAEMVASFAAALDTVDLPADQPLGGAELCLIRRRSGVFPPATTDLATGFATAAARMTRRREAKR